MSTLSLVRKRMINKSVPQIVSSFGNTSRDFFYFHSDGEDYRISFSGHNSSLKAYVECPPLAAIINKKAQAFINGKTFIVNKKGKARDKESNLEVAVKVRNLMANPNPFQGQKEFEAQLYTYVQLWGFNIIFFGSYPVGFDLYEAKRMWNIPPCMINVEETKKNWLLAESNKDIIKKIVIDFGGEKAELPLESCYIIKDLTVSFGNPLFPESRICSLKHVVNNIIGTYESRGKLIDYRGALGVISPDAKDVGGPVPMKEDDKIELQKDFKQYGLKRGQYSYIISNASVKYSQIGMPTRDLMLFEEIEDDIMRICDGLNYPYPLMSSNRTNSLGGNNIYEAKKLLYQDATIPEAESIYEQMNRLFNLDKYDLTLGKDFAHIPALQDDEQKTAQARKTRNESRQIEFYNNLCTLNEWRIANGDDPLEGDFGNMYYYELSALGWKFGSGGSVKPEQNNNQQQQEQNNEQQQE